MSAGSPRGLNRRIRIDAVVTIVDQPASQPISRDMRKPNAIPIPPLTKEMSTASTRNCRMMSPYGRCRGGTFLMPVALPAAGDGGIRPLFLGQIDLPRARGLLLRIQQ